jgi:hypothetical protein
MTMWRQNGSVGASQGVSDCLRKHCPHVIVNRPLDLIGRYQAEHVRLDLDRFAVILRRKP